MLEDLLKTIPPAALFKFFKPLELTRWAQASTLFKSIVDDDVIWKNILGIKQNSNVVGKELYKKYYAAFSSNSNYLSRLLNGETTILQIKNQLINRCGMLNIAHGSNPGKIPIDSTRYFIKEPFENRLITTKILNSHLYEDDVNPAVAIIQSSELEKNEEICNFYNDMMTTPPFLFIITDNENVKIENINANIADIFYSKLNSPQEELEFLDCLNKKLEAFISLNQAVRPLNLKEASIEVRMRK